MNQRKGLRQVLFKIETQEAFQQKISEENKKLAGKCKSLFQYLITD